MKHKILMTLILACLSVTAFCKAPEKCRILPGTTSSSGAIVFWEFPSGYNEVRHYNVYIDGNLAGSTDRNSFRIQGLDASTEYSITVSAIYRNRKEHAAEPVILKTLQSPEILNVKDFGAAGDGKTIDTRALQKAIDECPPFGEVHIPAGTYITGALFILKDNISIRLDEGATLKAVHNLFHFPLVKNRYEGQGVDAFASVVNIGELDGKRYSGIRIYGGGTIDNQGSILARQQTEALSRMSRSRGLPIINCDNVAIDSITVTNPCTWNVHPLLCNGVTTYGCTIVSSGFGLSNADGWDPDSSSECYLLNSTLDGQDDNIAIKSVQFMKEDGTEIRKPCENIHISFCRFIRGGGLCIGVELPSGVRNVWITNCTIENCDRGIQICSRQNNQGTGAIENIHFRDITIKRTGEWGININLWYWINSYRPGSFKSEDIREIKDIYFENIEICKTTGCPIQILGLKEQPVKGIHFKNVTIGGSQYEMLLRHCHDITFENVNVGERYWVFDNANDVSVDRKTSAQAEFIYPYRLVDPDATFGTKALYANLMDIQDSGKFVFGAQDATASGYGWNDNSGISDIERVTGKRPQMYCWDFMNIATPHADKLLDDTRKVRDLTCQAYYQGGVISYCWHAANPVTGGSFYETGDSIVQKILSGGEYHKRLTDMLDQIAEYNKTLIGKNGEHIPVIFRPWHEFDGDWFWWGKKYCSAEEFKELYRFTVSYLRDTCGIHNFLYAFSPDINFTTEEEYLERHPGDEYVDVIAMDNYWNFRYDEKDLSHAHLRLKVISDYAKKTGKLAALSETGQCGIDDPEWFTGRLLKSVYGYPEDQVKLAYIAVWRNSIQGFWTPYKGHPATEDFIKFVNDPRVIMADPYDWTNKFYHFDQSGQNGN